MSNAVAHEAEIETPQRGAETAAGNGRSHSPDHASVGNTSTSGSDRAALQEPVRSDVDDRRVQVQSVTAPTNAPVTNASAQAAVGPALSFDHEQLVTPPRPPRHSVVGTSGTSSTERRQLDRQATKSDARTTRVRPDSVQRPSQNGKYGRTDTQSSEEARRHSE